MASISMLVFDDNEHSLRPNKPFSIFTNKISRARQEMHTITRRSARRREVQYGGHSDGVGELGAGLHHETSASDVKVVLGASSPTSSLPQHQLSYILHLFGDTRQNALRPLPLYPDNTEIPSILQLP